MQEEGEEEEEGDDLNERLQKMKESTGMEFGSNPHEFDRYGISKYSAELNNNDDIDPWDEETEEMYNGRERYRKATAMKIKDSYNHRPPLNTIAYDSDIDKEISDNEDS